MSVNKTECRIMITIWSLSAFQRGAEGIEPYAEDMVWGSRQILFLCRHCSLVLESAMHCKPQRTSVLITKGRYEDDDIVQRGQVKGMVFLMNNLPSKHVRRNFDNHPKKALAVGVGVTL